MHDSMHECVLPTPAGRSEDCLPRYPGPASCRWSCHSTACNPNSLCRLSHAPGSKTAHAVTCAYGSKKYYHQPLALKHQVLDYYKQFRQEGHYN